MRPSRIYTRLAKGMSLEEALRGENLRGRRGHPVEYEGKSYPSIAALAREHHILYTTLYNRLKEGMTLEEALRRGNLQDRRGHPVEYGGKVYPTIRALADEQHVPYSMLARRIKEGMSPEAALQSRSIEYEGKVYPSIAALAREHHMLSTTLYNRLREGMTLEEAMKRDKHRQPIPIECGGKIYPSIDALARERHIPGNTLRHRLKMGLSADAALNYVRDYTGKKVEYGGKTYSSMKALANEQGVRAVALYRRTANGMSIEEALQDIRHHISKGHATEYGGKTYPSIKALADELRFSYGRLWSGLKKGMSVEEILNTGKDVRHAESLEPGSRIPANAAELFMQQEEDDAMNMEDETDEAAYIQTM